MVPSDGTVHFKPVAAYDLKLMSPETHNSKPNRPRRLPQLWRVCKLLYNETYDLPFAARNVFYFRDWATFMLLHKCDPRSLARIKSLWLTRDEEEGLTKLLQLQTHERCKVVSADEQIQQRRSNLRRVLPALVEIRIDNRIARWRTASPMSVVDPRTIRKEQDRMSKVLLFWESLVAKVMVEEAPQLVRDALYGPGIEG